MSGGVGGDAAAFLAFDREVRTAMSTADAALLGLLTRYPLRANDGEAMMVADAATLSAR